jgi:hypothetical protein
MKVRKNTNFDQHVSTLQVSELRKTEKTQIQTSITK